MEHQHCDIARVLLVRSDEECAERLAVGCRNEELLEVGYAELRRPWDVGTSVGREVPWIDNLTKCVSPKLYKVYQNHSWGLKKILTSV
jgi:hypothetical protein